MLICFAIAERLGCDVDDVLNWPYGKIRAWLAYFNHARKAQEKKHP